MEEVAKVLERAVRLRDLVNEIAGKMSEAEKLARVNYCLSPPLSFTVELEAKVPSKIFMLRRNITSSRISCTADNLFSLLNALQKDKCDLIDAKIKMMDGYLIVSCPTDDREICLMEANLADILAVAVLEKHSKVISALVGELENANARADVALSKIREILFAIGCMLR
jgi:hypothetical protein